MKLEYNLIRLAQSVIDCYDDVDDVQHFADVPSDTFTVVFINISSLFEINFNSEILFQVSLKS